MGKPQVKIIACSKCLKVTNRPTTCFNCMELPHDQHCYECDDYAEGSVGVEGVQQPICFACYWRQRNEEFQAKVMQKK